MKSMRVGIVLSSVVALGFIAVACDKQDPKQVKESNVSSEEVNVETAKVQEDEPAWINELLGDKLITADGSEVSSKVLADKTVGIYFSAHWCPPCRGFTPVLVKTYNELVAAGKSFELVFVSSDQNEEKMFGYMTETKMPWKALPFASSKKEELGKKYGVQGIPTLVIVDKDGKTISKNARGDVSSLGAAAFDKW